MTQIFEHYLKTRNEATQAIFEYIEVFYNRERIHSANDYLSPVEYESEVATLNRTHILKYF